MLVKENGGHFCGSSGKHSKLVPNMAVFSQDYRQRPSELTQRMTCLELNTDPVDIEQCTVTLFLPHTDATFSPPSNPRREN